MSGSARNEMNAILFVTGRLAEARLRDVLNDIAARIPLQFEIAVPGIQVAALLHTNLLLRRLHVPDHIQRVVLPGWCQGNLQELEDHFGRPFERGPKDLHDLPEYFGLGKKRSVDLSRYSIEIIAEINHATRLPLPELLEEARRLKFAGADVIDIGCIPGESSPRIRDMVSLLRAEGFRVSIDSFDRSEVEQAVAAGVELILSASHSNADWVGKLGTEVVAIPDNPHDLPSLDRLVDRLAADGTAFRLDPILEPVGVGFSESLWRYLDVRRKYPEVPMMMGVGNVTEMAEVDSAGVNLILAAICEELGIQSVLTTQVINWCRTAVAEFDAARRMVHHAVATRTIPKHISDSLVMLRSSKLHEISADTLSQLSAALTDSHFRIFAGAGEIHLMNRHGHWHGRNVFQLFEQATRRSVSGIDPGHAFYLGYELARAEISLHTGKQYNQDEPMGWGLLGDLPASSSVTSQQPPAEGTHNA